MKKPIIQLLILATLFTVSSASAMCPIEGPCCPPYMEQCACLAAGTEVMLASGQLAAIETITEEHKLMAAYAKEDITFASLTPALMQLQESSIGFASVNPSDNKVMYELVDTLGNTLVATGDHPIITANRGPVAMASLEVGDTLITTIGETFVTSLKIVEYEGLVHNFLLGNPQHSFESVAEDFMEQSFFANNILVGDLHLQYVLGN